LKHEILGKTLAIPFDRLIQDASLDVVERREIGVE
jgi:hypothetical protein